MSIFKPVFLLTATALVVTACIAPPTESPIPSIPFADADSRNETLVVMLPGRGDRGDVFQRQGFEVAGQEHGFDTVMVDAHFGYYMKRSLIPALHEDIILPARKVGYENIWLLGVSMGGLGSLLYASEHSEEVDGLILLAPFLGDDDVIKEVMDSGGLAAWKPEASKLEDYEIAVWSWLQQATNPASRTPIMLGYGDSDRLAEAYPLLIDSLRAENVFSTEGGHDWVTWRVLWKEISNRLIVRRES